MRQDNRIYNKERQGEKWSQALELQEAEINLLRYSQKEETSRTEAAGFFGRNKQ